MGLINEIFNSTGYNNLRTNNEFSGDSLIASTPVGGVRVDQNTALQLAAFWACVRYISTSIAVLPWGVFKISPQGGRIPQPNHRAYSILKDTPTPGMTAFSWRETMLWNALVGGNSLSEITTQGLELIDEPVQFVDLEDGGLAYKLLKSNRLLLAPDVFHLKGPSRDGKVGLSVISASRETFGLGLAEQTYGASFYAAGTHVGGVYEHPGRFTPEQLKELREQLDADKGAGKAHKPRILTQGMTYKSDTISQQDAQYLESRKFTDRQIAMIFGVQPHKIGIEDGSTAYASREVASIDSVIDTLMPWAVRNEQEANNKLLTVSERRRGFFTKMNLDVHLRGDSNSRAEFYEKNIRNAVMTPNQARAKEDMEAIDGGDDLVISRDMIPLHKINEFTDSQITKNENGGSNVPNNLAPILEDAMNFIKKRAAEDRKRKKPIEKTRDFARIKLEPIVKACQESGFVIDIDKLIDEGVKE